MGRFIERCDPKLLAVQGSVFFLDLEMPELPAKRTVGVCQPGLEHSGMMLALGFSMSRRVHRYIQEK